MAITREITVNLLQYTYLVYFRSTLNPLPPSSYEQETPYKIHTNYPCLHIALLLV